MGKLLKTIQVAVLDDRFIVSCHADERCEEREVSVWQLAVGIEDGQLVRERPRSKPHPSVVVRQFLADGSDVEVVWPWLADSRRARFITATIHPPKKPQRPLTHTDT